MNSEQILESNSQKEVLWGDRDAESCDGREQRAASKVERGSRVEGEVRPLLQNDDGS